MTLTDVDSREDNRVDTRYVVQHFNRPSEQGYDYHYSGHLWNVSWVEQSFSGGAIVTTTGQLQAPLVSGRALPENSTAWNAGSPAPWSGSLGNPHRIDDAGAEHAATNTTSGSAASWEDGLEYYVDFLGLDAWSNAVFEWSGWFGDWASTFSWYVGSAYDSLVGWVLDPGAELAYLFVVEDGYTSATEQAFQYLVDAAAGAVDGLGDTLNPFDNYWSIPDIGSVYGTNAYTVGYVGGTVAGIGIQLYVGNVSALGLCGTKLGTAISLYNKAQFVGDLMPAVESAVNIAQGNGTWGDVAQIGMTVIEAALSVKGGCFPTGTPVLTYEGLKSIEHVQRDEQVWAYDVRVGEWQLRRVLDTFATDFEGTLVKFTVNGEEIATTDHHPVYVLEGADLANRPHREHVPLDPLSSTPGRWLDAIDLRVGDVMLLKGGKTAQVKALKLEAVSIPVYNFEVEELHCYAVGLNHVLVHNNAACQDHHIATHYGKIGEKFKAIFSKAGMNVKTATENIMPLAGHVGRHIKEYHQLVFDRLDAAVRGLRGAAAQKSLINELDLLRKELNANPRLPFKDGGLRLFK